jgi:hypothetical protein
LAALAVAAIVASWAVAQQPRFLPGLTVSQGPERTPTRLGELGERGLGFFHIVTGLC